MHRRPVFEIHTRYIFAGGRTENDQYEHVLNKTINVYIFFILFFTVTVVLYRFATVKSPVS